MSQLAAHPIANAFPAMTDVEFEGLKQSIAKNGVRNPVIIYEGKILDGRHRYMACIQLGIECPTIEWEGDACPVEYVSDTNSHRRSLTASQRAAVAVALIPLYAEEAKKRQGLAPNGADVQDAGKSAAKAAKATGASTRMVERAKKVAKNAPELVGAIAQGEITVSQAEAQVEEAKTAASNTGVEPKVAEAMNSRKTFAKLSRDIRAMKAEINALASTTGGRLLNTQQIDTLLNDAARAVEFAMPAFVCPYKSCETRGCKACGGHRWISKEQWDRVPENIRNAATAEAK